MIMSYSKEELAELLEKGKISISQYKGLHGVQQPEPVAKSLPPKIGPFRRMLGRWAYRLLGILPDDLESDGTDWAHPAWHRGEEHGAIMAAKALTRIANEGVHRGRFGGDELNVAADAILARGNK